jgi:hypothetical protein
MLHCYVLMCGRSVTAFLVPPRSQGPARPNQSPALLEGPPMPERSKVMIQTKRHPGPPGWGLGGGLTTHPFEKIAVTKTHEMSLGGKGKWRRPWQCLTGGPRPWIEMDGGL